MFYIILRSVTKTVNINKKSSLFEWGGRRRNCFCCSVVQLWPLHGAMIGVARATTARHPWYWWF